jgi:hypothetical protein
MFYNQGVTSFRVMAILLLLAAAGCRYLPAYQGAACADREPRCPPGLVCLEGRCLPPPDERTDGADAGKEEVPVAGDESPPGGEDASFDESSEEDAFAGDQSADGGDGEDAEGDQIPADQDACGGSCPEGYFCNAASGTCLPCNTPDHCGQSCVACSDGEQCLELSGEYCCRGECSGESACRVVSCGLSGWICSLVFNPEESWKWQEITGKAYFCTLNPPDQPGHSVPVEETFRCSESDPTLLEFFCTYDGACAEGSCRALAAARKAHNCGTQFGCDPQRQRCRRHKKDGESCRFNFDCESFCCSRQQSAVCITPSSSNRSECKIATTEYTRWEGGWLQDFTWVAFSEQDPHDINSWNRLDGHSGDSCQQDFDCDSGDCGNYSKKCRFANCLDDMSSSAIRNKYFCPAGVGDGSSAVYIPTVTNNDPLPQDDDCPDRQLSKNDSY